MEEIQQNQLRLVVYPMICKVLAPCNRWLANRDFWLPSTVWHHDLLVSAGAFQEDARDDRYSHPPFARCIPASQFSTANIVKTHSQGGWKNHWIQGLWRSKEGASSADVCFSRLWWKKARGFKDFLSLTKFEKPKVPCCHFTKPKKLEFAFQRCFGRSACFEITKPLFWNS